MTDSLPFFTTEEHTPVLVTKGGRCNNCVLDNPQLRIWCCSCGAKTGCTDCTKDHLRENHVKRPKPVSREPRPGFSVVGRARQIGLPVTLKPFKFNREAFVVKQQQ